MKSYKPPINPLTTSNKESLPFFCPLTKTCVVAVAEGELAVLLLNEVFAERAEEQDAQDATQQRGDEHLPEVDLDLVTFALKNVERGQGEDSTCHYAA